MTDHAPNILVLQASVDPEAESEFRVLVDNKFVKYITIDPGVFGVDDMCFGPSLIPLLPPLPAGDWTTGCISRDPKTGDAHFSAVSETCLQGITKTWHSTRVDHLELHEKRKLRSNVYEVTCPGFSSTIIAKFARFEWEVAQLERETMAYEWIEGQQIGPTFLGHLIEEGRVIGFLMDRIADCRHATPEDYTLCHSVLSKLHKLGIKHGDINKHNFLIHDGRATLIDFDNASRPASDEELEAEAHDLLDQLRDTSGRGGQVVENGPC
ncbi:alpha-galactosidase A precursor [Rostrohypoxylon terebratum]|nr:alpha-galactosidase A precursor [Rostrohypoxylon terebratum]